MTVRHLRRFCIVALSLLAACGDGAEPAEKVGTSSNTSTLRSASELSRAQLKRQPELFATLRRRLPRANQSGYGCTVLPGPGAKLVVHVANRAAERSAQRTVKALRAGQEVTIVPSASTLTHTEARRIETELTRAAPGDLHGIEREAPIGLGRCPRITIVLAGDSSDATVQWAKDAASRYGEEKVAYEVREINKFGEQ